MIGARDTIQDPTVVTCTFPVNGLYTTVLFDSGVDKNFITPKFRALLSHKYKILDDSYIVEMANRESGSA